VSAGGRGGFTLVEVVVALLVLAVATVATTEILLMAARDGRHADLRERILWEATAVADSLAREPAVDAGSRSLQQGVLLEWEGSPGGGWVRVTDPGRGEPWLELPVPLRGTRATLGGSP